LSTRLVAGIDLGSTGIKLLIARADGTELLIEQRPTPWRSGAAGTTELTADDLLETVRELLVATAERLRTVTDDQNPSVAAIAISGMGESGLLVDPAGKAAAPAIAWFDPRGRDQVEALPSHLVAEFAGRTGLPVGVQVSVVKLLNLRENGIGLGGLQWFNLPEFVAAALGGRAVSEYSLASRTGLLDQDSGKPWPEMMDYLGVTPDFLPPLTDAGTDLGTADAGWLPAAFGGARVTVAGHDHLVSAVSGGAIPDDRYHASMGTAEVLLRVLDAPLSPEARARLASRLINSVRHVVPGQHVLVAGVKSGILMRRALQLAGIVDSIGRDQLDARVLALPFEGSLADGAIEVRGARNDDGVLRLTVRGDGVSPAETFGAVLRHGNDEIRLLIEAMEQEVPPARATVLTGGWAAMASVRRARSAVLPGLVVSQRSQDTAYGAALFASRLLEPVAQTNAQR
jgi:sugar (pentulose or hexulose) kinase